MIELNNRVKGSISQNDIKKIITKAARHLKIKILNLSIALVPGAEIKKINRKYRRKNSVTDVLSFNYNDCGNKKDIDGEIVICYNQAKTQARQLGHSIDVEIKKLLMHGFLHLAGYDHQTEKPAGHMFDLEKKLLNLSRLPG